MAESEVASITTRVTPKSSNRQAMSCSERVIVEYVVTSWTRREPPVESGTRTQHTSSALPISRAATRVMISCSSCASSNTSLPSFTVTASNEGGCPQELLGQ